jgi:hypothetical protein
MNTTFSKRWEQRLVVLCFMSRNSSFTWDIVQNNPEEPWDLGVMLPQSLGSSSWMIMEHFLVSLVIVIPEGATLANM